MQFVFSSLAAAQEPSATALRGGDADDLARLHAELFGSEDALLGPARRLLDSTRVSDFLSANSRRSIASLDAASMLVSDAMKLLHARRVLAAPLFDVHRQRFLTILDCGDFLRAFLNTQALMMSDGSAAALQSAGEKFSALSLVQVAPPEADCDGETLSVDVAGDVSLLDVAASVFLRPAKSHARVAVAHRCVCFSYAPDAELSRFGWKPSLALNVVGILSQSDLIRHLHAHAAQLGPLRDASVCDLQLGTTPVACVGAGVSALDAFKLMFERRFGACGLLSPAGTLIGNLSASDLCGLMPHQYGRLCLPAATFAAEQHAESLMLVAVAPGSTFFSVLERMVHARVHHVYVVDDQGRPVSMITPTDILRYITPPGEHSVAEPAPLSRQLAHQAAVKASLAAADAAAHRVTEHRVAPPPPRDVDIEREAAALAEAVRNIVHESGGDSKAVAP